MINLFDGTLNIKSTSLILKERGLEEGGKVQQFKNAETKRRRIAHTPTVKKELVRSVNKKTVIGTGLIEYGVPYDRFLYYGKLMVSPTTGSSWALRGEKKILTDIDLRYNRSIAPLSGSFWFERMKTDKKQGILEGAQKVADGVK